jgi:hypothetical protein
MTDCRDRQCRELVLAAGPNTLGAWSCGEAITASAHKPIAAIRVHIIRYDDLYSGASQMNLALAAAIAVGCTRNFNCREAQRVDGRLPVFA